MEIQVFISYSHEDEWLKDELLQHLSSLKRGGTIDLWHDRKISAGSVLDQEIQSKVQESQIFLFLISPAFLASDYCVEKEYLLAKRRHENGEAVVIPIIVRDCDWDLHGLRDFSALPVDAKAVTRNAHSKSDSQQRDGKWLEVVGGLKEVVKGLKKKLTPPDLNPDYLEGLFKVDFIRHPSLQKFDERKIIVDPEIYYEREKKQINNFHEIVDAATKTKAMVFTGSDRSGKSLMAKRMQVHLTELGEPALLIDGARITNADIERFVNKAKASQLTSTGFANSKTTVVVDNFDECKLPDSVKEKMIRYFSESFGRIVIFAFTSAPSVLFAPDDLPNPQAFAIEPLGDDKVYQLVKKWKTLSNGDLSVVDDELILQSHEKIMLLFNQTDMQKYAYNVVTFLELLDSSLGSDIAPSSFASCYETLIQQRLIRAKFDPRQLDELKNFLSLVAYKAFIENEIGEISRDGFGECLQIFEEQFFSDQATLIKMSVGSFLYKTSEGYRFQEDYLWYFLCARYVGRTLSQNDNTKYLDFITKCVKNIFQKKFANIIIYLAYFTDDNSVIKELMALLDELFHKAEDWKLSDKSRSIILGLANSDELSISASSEIDENRLELMKDKISDIVDDAEQVVAKYALPFLDPNIEDSEFVDSIDESAVDTDSYMKSVNALLRTHSVIGQILNSRSGTYSAQLVMDCITKMVQASGRYASLNHAIATVLMYDPQQAIRTANDTLRVENLTPEEKQKKVTRIFSFWSVYLSQTGLARYLSQDHSVRALERLVDKHESSQSDEGHYPFNFTSVLIISRLYRNGKVDKASISEALRKYGDNSSLFAVIRATLHIYSYYMPMSIMDKQWVSKNLKIPLRSIEMQKVRAGSTPHINRKQLMKIGDEATSEQDEA